MTTGPATIADVAASANVSPSTVSLVLNDRGNVREQTRQRVREAMASLNYQPRRSSRDSDNQTKRYRITILYPGDATTRDGSVSEPHALALPAIHHQLRPHCDSLNVLAGMNHVSQDTIFAHLLDAGELDGVILLGVSEHDGYRELLAERHIPTVGLGRVPASPASSYSAVSLDNYEAGRVAARFFAEHGHTRLAAIGDARKTNINTQRLDGFCAEAQARGVRVVGPWDVDSTKLEFAPEPHAAYQHLAEQLLAEEATALFTVMDKIGIGIANALDAMGVNVPQRMQIIGCDNLDRRTTRGARISSIDYDKHEIGRLAVESLLLLMDPARSVNRIITTLKPNVAEHDTTMPA